MTEFEIDLYFASALDNKLRSPPLLARKKFERHFSDIMDLAHHQIWISLPDLST